MSDDTLNVQPEKQPETVQNNPEKSPNPESSKEQNMRILRERAENAEAKIRQMEQYMTQQQQQKPVEDDLGIDDDSYVEARYLKKIHKELKETKKQMEEMSNRAIQQTAEIRLKSQYADFDAVVNEENIKEFAVKHPEEYSTLLSNPDLYAKGKTAYNMIKHFGLKDKYENVDKKMEENKSKPRSSASAPSQPADAPLTRVGDYDRRILSDERKKQLYEQVSKSKQYS
jgi:gas vesicle protein